MIYQTPIPSHSSQSVFSKFPKCWEFCQENGNSISGSFYKDSRKPLDGSIYLLSVFLSVVILLIILHSRKLFIQYILNSPITAWFLSQTHRYVCKVCKRGFHQMINLHRHEQIHCNTSKQFQCAWCLKMGYQGANCFKTHLDRREGGILSS